MCVCTFSPRSSSLSDRLISQVRKFMRSHSWKATTMYGVLSSTLAISSGMLNSSVNFSRMSSSSAFTYMPEWGNIAETYLHKLLTTWTRLREVNFPLLKKSWVSPSLAPLIKSSDRLLHLQAFMRFHVHKWFWKWPHIMQIFFFSPLILCACASISVLIWI